MPRIKRNDRYYRLQLHPSTLNSQCSWSLTEIRYRNDIPHSGMLDHGVVDLARPVVSIDDFWDITYEISRVGLLR